MKIIKPNLINDMMKYDEMSNVLHLALLKKRLVWAVDQSGPCDKNGKRLPRIKADPKDPLHGAGRADGTLNSSCTDMPYLAWEPGDEDATLDGDFTLAELKAIVKWMEKHKSRR